MLFESDWLLTIFGVIFLISLHVFQSFEWFIFSYYVPGAFVVWPKYHNIQSNSSKSQFVRVLEQRTLFYLSFKDISPSCFVWSKAIFQSIADIDLCHSELGSDLQSETILVLVMFVCSVNLSLEKLLTYISSVIYNRIWLIRIVR